MAGKKLEVGIGADISDFQKKIKEVEFDLKELSKAKVERIKLGLDTGEINNQIKDVKKTLNDLKTTTRDTGNAFNSMAPKVANGGAALTSFSRIAQDAPYGIIGVGNNITNTAEQFGYLVKETGSAGGALKAMLSSLAGVGGVLLGVSLLTTGLTLMAQQGLTVSDVIDKLTGKYDEFGNTIKKASEEGAKAAGSEVSALQSLVSVAQNDNLSKKERLIAVDKLQKQFPGYYGQLSDEKILYGDLKKVTKEATQALVDRAIAEKLVGSNADIFVERLKANARYRKAADELNAFDKKAEKELASLKNVSAAQIAIIQARQLNTRNDLIDKVTEERNNIIKLTGDYDRLQNVINQLSASSINLFQEPTTTKAKTPDKFKNLDGTINKGKIFTAGGIVNPNLGLQTPDLGVDEAAINASEKLRMSLEAQKLIIADFNKQVSDLINSTLSGTFENLGQSIGDAIANGTNIVQSLGQSLIQSLGMFIGELGKKMITYGMLLAGFGKAQKAFEAGDATVKIGAGIAMVALGVAAVAAGRAVSSLGASGRASGGGGGSRGGGGTSTAYSSTSTGYSGGGMSGNVVFEISGQKLIGVLNNTLNGNKRLGGAVGLG